jgi:hypothetical protein
MTLVRLLQSWMSISRRSKVPSRFQLSACKKLKKTVLPNGVVACGMSSSKYVQYAVQNVQEYLIALTGDQKLLKKSPAPFAGDYKPELDESSELDLVVENLYQSQIGILRWCVELRCIDIITDV